jgi:NAD-dependent SIR2 family protein deacetylase
MTCRKITPTEEIQERLDSGDPAPDCKCGGYLKPDTISFGQAMPVVEVEKATALSQTCDFFLVVGSTLLVQPALFLRHVIFFWWWDRRCWFSRPLTCRFTPNKMAPFWPS